MRVVVVEDQILFKEFLVDLLGNKLGHAVVGIAEYGESALQVIRETGPDMVLLDILIPKLSGIHVAQTILTEFPQTRILALSAEMDAKTLHQVNRLRLNGFVDKNEASVEVLSQAIDLVGQNKRYFSESMKTRIRQLQSDPLSFQKILTRREQEVLTHIGAGLSDDEIGNILELSPTSVQSHRSNLMRKLGLHGTPELIRFANDTGFWKPAFERMNLRHTYHTHD
jgi:DNA-binding NarL/FixJ family response regulator